MKKGNWEKSCPAICVLMGDIMQSVENALLIGKISFVMMLLRGQACRWGTGSHMKSLISRIAEQQLSVKER